MIRWYVSNLIGVRSFIYLSESYIISFWNIVSNEEHSSKALIFANLESLLLSSFRKKGVFAPSYRPLKHEAVSRASKYYKSIIRGSLLLVYNTMCSDPTDPRIMGTGLTKQTSTVVFVNSIDARIRRIRANIARPFRVSRPRAHFDPTFDTWGMVTEGYRSPSQARTRRVRSATVYWTRDPKGRESSQSILIIHLPTSYF